jgi:7-alpha-hydroxysteroid dehydrogenase
MSDPFRLDGKRAVVTGAGKGIGRGISLQLARAGADLVISSRTQEDLDSLAIEIEALGRQVTKVVVDVTKTAELEDLAAQAVAGGGIDVWVNNAGGLPDATPRYLTKTPEDRWDAQLDLNLKAVFIACQVAANNMDEGAIINISSSSAKSQGSVKNGPYGASKAAVNSLTQTFALELAPKIRVNAVAPLARLGTPDDIGHAVVFMASPASSWVTGQCLFVTGGT